MSTSCPFPKTNASGYALVGFILEWPYEDPYTDATIVYHDYATAVRAANDDAKIVPLYSDTWHYGEDS